MKRILVATILLLAVLYASDYLFAVIRKNNPKAGQAFGTVTVQHYYSIPHKDGKAELVFQDPQTQACIRSLFPHFGYTPCWYARRESQTPIPMIIVALGGQRSLFSVGRRGNRDALFCANFWPTGCMPAAIGACIRATAGHKVSETRRFC